MRPWPLCYRENVAFTEISHYCPFLHVTYICQISIDYHFPNESLACVIKASVSITGRHREERESFRSAKRSSKFRPALCWGKEHLQRSDKISVPSWSQQVQIVATVCTIQTKIIVLVCKVREITNRFYESIWLACAP